MPDGCTRPTGPILPTCLCQFRSLSRWSVIAHRSATSICDRLADGTNVLMRSGPDKPTLRPETASWLRERADALFLSTITAAEIEAGIAKLHRTGHRARAERFARMAGSNSGTIYRSCFVFRLPAARIAGGFYRLLLRLKEASWVHGYLHRGHCPCTSAHHPDRQSASLSAARCGCAQPVRLELRRWN